VVENTTAAESRIRDTDMAKEMVRYSNTNIIAQAGQAMLATANQANQAVLSLLQ
jgi:flagellin